MSIPKSIQQLYKSWAGEAPTSISLLPPSGSYRSYYRITSENHNVLGAINNDVKENIAFIEFSRFFKAQGLKVPKILAVDDKQVCYLLEDFGHTTLYDLLTSERTGEEIPEQVAQFYKKSAEQLIEFQLKGRALDFTLCYPRNSFDRQSMMWDMHYFKYYFLKLATIPFDEQLLEDDFIKFSDSLLEAESDYFMYRDFQSRNIMIVDNEPAFIDYQGGRKGALQYDLASLLFDAKADLPTSFREELLCHYIHCLSQQINVDEALFRKHFYGFALIRTMQAMGAYGFRGFYEKKEHFLKSIPFAIENLKYILQQLPLQNEFPMLHQALVDVTKSQRLLDIADENRLTVTINSFSYKRGIPVDFSGHGGGFVFDCRSIHNPGRYPEHKEKTGKDAEVIAFFNQEPEMEEFLNNVYKMVDTSVEKYLSREFKHLMVNFGCTGGQHRSVFCAEKLSAHLSKKYPVKINLKHVEQDMRS